MLFFLHTETWPTVDEDNWKTLTDTIVYVINKIVQFLCCFFIDSTSGPSDVDNDTISFFMIITIFQMRIAMCAKDYVNMYETTILLGVAYIVHAVAYLLG